MTEFGYLYGELRTQEKKTNIILKDFYGTEMKTKFEHKRDKKNGVTVKNVAEKHEGQWQKQVFVQGIMDSVEKQGL